VLADLRARLARYRAPLWESGFQVRAVARSGEPVDLEIVLAANDDQTLSSIDRLGDAPSEFALATDSRSIRWKGRVGTSPVGFRFDRPIQLAADEGITVTIRANGADVPAAAITTGADAHPATSPFVYKEIQPKGAPRYEEPVMLVTAAPAVTPPTDVPVRVYLWRVAGSTTSSAPAVGTDAKTREHLKALGYVHDD
jgi:hypothetical protein